ncbi:MAG: 50S ribosome-binding GTPase [Methanobacteriota archaeon]|nr:MAG: 50S ribosome-binding GTPase [Euryarchaeota archaeon]
MLDIPTVLTADEILDKAFRKASKVDVRRGTRLDTVRQINISKLKSSSDVIVSTLGRYVKSFPSIEALSPFYSELIDVTIGTDRLKKSLGAMDWCRGQVAKVSRAAVRDMSSQNSTARIDELRRGTYGRISSLVKQVDGELKFLAKARSTIKKFPTIDHEAPTTVIGGAPNVGKSQLVRRMSTAKPRVAVYPFTTQEVSVGVFERARARYQVIDTPGLLDRPLSERNAIELRAVLALRHLADVVVFVIDPSETCGYTRGQQERLLSSLKTEFRDVPIIEVENKVDLLDSGSSRMKISAITGTGVDALVDEVVSALAA